MSPMRTSYVRPACLALLVGTSRIVVGVFGDANAPVSEGRRGP